MINASSKRLTFFGWPLGFFSTTPSLLFSSVYGTSDGYSAGAFGVLFFLGFSNSLIDSAGIGSEGVVGSAGAFGLRTRLGFSSCIEGSTGVGSAGAFGKRSRLDF